MNMLAFDTCFGACSAVVTWPGGHAARYAEMERGHAEALMPMIADVMAEAAIAFDALDLIAVTVGPGTFTGARIGISAARALALSTGARLAGVSSLEVMARTAAARLAHAASDTGTSDTARDLAVAVDARRGQIYFQLFDGACRPLSEPALLTPADAVQLLRARPTVVVGSGGALVGAVAGGAASRQLAVMLADLEPDARHIGRPEAAASSSLVRPLYLRPPDAKPQTDKSLARVP